MVQIQERVGKLTEDLQALIYKKERQAPAFRMLRGTDWPEDVGGPSGESREEIAEGLIQGESREYFRFRTSVEIPEDWEGEWVVYEVRTGVDTLWDSSNPQFTVYVNGTLRQGFDENHRQITLTQQARAGERFEILLSAYTGDQQQKFILYPSSRIRILDRRTEKYFYDISVPFHVAELLEREDVDYIRILTCLNESLNLVDFRKPYSESYYASLEAAQRYITENFYDRECKESGRAVYCVGHTHIDCAWLWTLAVTERKAVRSFSTALELMREYPEYIFMSGQPQLYQYVKKNAPEIYEEIRQRVREGRWEADGGMWVEADCNISSGESLVRQFMYGQRFFREEFGVTNCMLWLPDVFGYSAALPQIMKKCGLSYFMTTKINWNEFNKMPCDTFMWEGIDGSRVLTHFIPTQDYKKETEPGRKAYYTTYNGSINPSQIRGGWERYSQKYLNGEVLNSFGYGDGGGGPTKEMLENQRRLARGIPGCPRTVMSTARHFFQVLESHVKDSRYLPSWVGELYLEYHRGTYTSMARNKRYNRKSEYAYGNLENYGYMNLLWNGGAYPEDLLRRGWETLLKNQFHDILPGSSIRQVYEDSREEYEEILSENEICTVDILEQLAAEADTEEGNLVVFWPNSSAALGTVCFSEESGVPVRVSDGQRRYPVQRIGEGSYLFRAEALPSKGYRSFQIHYEGETPEENGLLRIGTDVMENEFIRLELNKKGQFSRIYDKRQRREILKEGCAGNVIMTYEDRPHKYDAWDLNHYYTEKSWEADDVQSMEVTESGPVRGCVRIVRKYLDSVICQEIFLYADSARVDIRNVIDWREEHIFVKALFPVDIHTSEAVFDIQYGNVKRPTHANTSWDMARFEVCMHKWVDVSEDGYGVALLNDCKYGCSVRDGVIGLSLLKCATHPNPDADRERHEFIYSILPHRGDFREGSVVAEAAELNNPARAVRKKGTKRGLPREASLAAVDQPNVIIEAIKKAETEDAMILRLYECFNRRSEVTLTLGGKLREAFRCNMLEEEDVPVPFDGNRISFSIRPYEILTFRLRFEVTGA